MKIFSALLLLCLISCSDSTDKPIIKTKVQDVNWPKADIYIPDDSSFSLKLHASFGALQSNKLDTLSSIYGTVLQKMYISNGDSLQIIISVNNYNKEVFQKQPINEIFESTINSFLYSLHAQKAQSMNTEKYVGENVLKGTRTFYSFSENTVSYYGCSELYSIAPNLYHICVIAKDKNAFIGNSPAGLAFTSFSPSFILPVVTPL